VAATKQLLHGMGTDVARAAGDDEIHGGQG
jgi:hypothetical protein